MDVGRGDIDVARRRRFSLPSHLHRKLAGPAEHIRQVMTAPGGDVGGDEDAGVEVFGQSGQDGLEDLRATARAANSYDISLRHGRLLARLQPPDEKLGTRLQVPERARYQNGVFRPGQLASRRRGQR